MPAEQFSFPSLDQVLAALRLVDQWISEREAELKLKYPAQAAELDAILTKLKTAEAMVAVLGLLAGELQVLATGKGPTSQDDVDLA